MPRIKRSIIDSASVEAFSRAGPVTPPELPANDVGDIDIISADAGDAALREEKFMNEKIEIEIEAGSEPNDPVYVLLGHNGSMQTVERGKIQTVRRKYLYSALMAKRVAINCSFGKDGAGNEFNRLTPSVSTSYRARLISDPNPQGGSKWVQRVMAESAGAPAR